MKNNHCESHCVLTVSGPVAQSVTELLRERFDGTTLRIGINTLLIVDDVDQAAVRALMIMLWDFGHEVVTMMLVPTEPSEPTEPAGW